MTDTEGRSLLHSLSCRCKASRQSDGWRIEAEAFLCAYRHKQGEIVTFTTEQRNRMIDDEWDRAEREYLEQPL